MNKFFKGLVVLFGAVNSVFGIFIPLGFALIYLAVYGYQGSLSLILIILGIISSLYRAINIGFLKG